MFAQLFVENVCLIKRNTQHLFLKYNIVSSLYISGSKKTEKMILGAGGAGAWGGRELGNTFNLPTEGTPHRADRRP